MQTRTVTSTVLVLTEEDLDTLRILLKYHEEIEMLLEDGCEVSTLVTAFFSNLYDTLEEIDNED